MLRQDKGMFVSIFIVSVMEALTLKIIISLWQKYIPQGKTENLEILTVLSDAILNVFSLKLCTK